MKSDSEMHGLCHLRQGEKESGAPFYPTQQCQTVAKMVRLITANIGVSMLSTLLDVNVCFPRQWLISVVVYSIPNRA